MHLSHRLYDSVLRILPRLYACSSARDFMRRAVAVLPNVIEADGYGWFVLSFTPRPELVDWVESEPQIINTAMSLRMGESARSHPFTLHWAGAKEISALKFSDFPLSVRQRFLSANWDIHRDMGREYLTSPVSFRPREIHAVSIRRDRRSFTEQDRVVMNLLAPHFRRAHANALAFDRATGRGSLSAIATQVDLTSRESEVALWLAEGKTNSEIGLILGIATRTVDKHVEHLLKKLGVENRATAAVRIANALNAPRHSSDT